MRIDKWLWAARFFKTRSLAAKACELGRVHCNDQPAKPSREIHLNDIVAVKNESGEYRVEVLLLSEVRGPAAVAQTLFRETDASREARLNAIEDRKTMARIEPLHEGRPSARDRRWLNRLRGRF